MVFRPTVRSLVTSGSERNRSGACHGSLGRSNRVTFYPKKESLSKKNFPSLRGVPITNYTYTIANLHLLPRFDGCATTSHNTFLCQNLCPRPVAVAGRTVLLLCHTVTPISNTPPICSRPSHVTTAEQSVEIPQYALAISNPHSALLSEISHRQNNRKPTENYITHHNFSVCYSHPPRSDREYDQQCRCCVYPGFHLTI